MLASVLLLVHLQVLPVVLKKQHEPRAMAALPQRVSSMLGLPSSKKPTPRNLLDVMAKMMNTLVVEVSDEWIYGYGYGYMDMYGHAGCRGQ